jgi:hypothetical protein
MDARRLCVPTARRLRALALGTHSPKQLAVAQAREQDRGQQKSEIDDSAQARFQKIRSKAKERMYDNHPEPGDNNRKKYPPEPKHYVIVAEKAGQP